VGLGKTSAQSNLARDADLARAEDAGLRDLRMVMEELVSRGLPGAADDFPWPVLTHDGDRILHANPACLRWFGCSGDGSLVQQPLTVLARPEDERALIAALGAAPVGPPAAPHIQRFCDQSGTTLLGRVLAQRHELEGARVTFVLIAPGSNADRSFELLRLLGGAVDHLTDIVFITEAHAIDGVGRRIVFVNRAFTRSSGYEAKDVLGKTPNLTIGEGTDRNVLARLEAALRETRPVCEDLLKYAKNGTPYWVELQIIPMFDETGQHSHWLSIQRDITERKRMESRLLESARLAAAGQLSASLASELNTPLASVVSSLEWLSERLPTLLAQLTRSGASGSSGPADAQEVLEALSDAQASAARLAAATSHLQLLGGAPQLTRHALMITPLCESAIAEAERELGAPLVVERQFESDLVVIGDAGRLSHALRLALVNGALASAADRRKLRLELTTASNRVHIAIEAEGPGVTSDLVGVVNAPFPSRKPQGIGDALGLFVASRLVAELEGELVLVQRPAATRVEIRLPRAR
jgi:PAS domain S-box-containing protein